MSEDSQAWAWVPVMWARYRTWEQAKLKQTSAAVRSTQHSVVGAYDTACTWACEMPERGFARAAELERNGRTHIQRFKREYPEGFVLGTSLVMRSYLGNAPRRLMLVGMGAAFILREPLVAKWGGAVAHMSSVASNALKAKAIESGLLPPPPAPSPRVPAVDTQS